MIVHRDSPFQQFADLRGCSWAYNEPESQSGYGITRYRLVQMGETQGFFAQVIETGFHQTAIRMVAERRIDAAAIDSHVLAVALRDAPDLQIRIIDTLGPSTIQPFVALHHISPYLAADVQSALVQVHQSTVMQAHLNAGLIDHFVAVDDSAYDDIRVMFRACLDTDFLTLR